MHYTNILLSCPTLSALEIDTDSRSRPQLHFYSKKLILVIFICFSNLYPPLPRLNQDPYYDIAFLYCIISIIMIFPPFSLCWNQGPCGQDILDDLLNDIRWSVLHKHTFNKYNLAVAQNPSLKLAWKPLARARHRWNSQSHYTNPSFSRGTSPPANFPSERESLDEESTTSTSHVYCPTQQLPSTGSRATTSRKSLKAK